jgi:DnaK suppressor protein
MSELPHTRYEARLVDERARAQWLIAKLTGDFNAVVEATREVATDDEHDPEGATIAYERAQLNAILTKNQAHLVEIDLALDRVRNGSYGTCQNCNRLITQERLEAQPAANSCVACASTPTRRLGRTPPRGKSSHPPRTTSPTTVQEYQPFSGPGSRVTSSNHTRSTVKSGSRGADRSRSTTGLESPSAWL